MSCEQVVELELPPHESKLNINAMLIAGDDLDFPQAFIRSSYQTTITASNTVGAFSTERIKFLKDAKIEFITDNTFSEILDPVSLGLRFSEDGGFDTTWGFFPSSSLAPRSYEIRASHPDFDGPVIGRQRLPEFPDVTILNRTDGADTRLRFRLADGLGKQQYIIRVYGYDSSTGISEETVFFSCITAGFSTLSQFDDFDFEDPSGLPVTSQGLLKDVGFDGQAVEIELIVYGGFSGVRMRYVVELISVTEDFETYMRSFYRNQNAEFNPFAEPVSVYNNVSGAGVGVVLGGTRRTMVFP